MRNETYLKSIIIWLFTLTVTFSVNTKLSIAIDTTYFNDGQTHNINYKIGNYVQVDYLTPGVQTKVNFLPGADILFVESYGDSHVSVAGGEIQFGLQVHDESQASLTNGVVSRNFGVYEHSLAIMSGGRVEGSVHGFTGYGQFILSGGTVRDFFSFGFDSTLTIYGSDFKIAGTPVGYGEYKDISHSHITGILANGNVLNNDFYLGRNGKLILIPEPCTLMLLGLGTGILRKKTRR